MSKFEDYLQEMGFKPQTVYQHRKYASHFLAWTAEQSLAIEQITYTEILDFADHLKKDNKNINLINKMMLAVRYYFTYLQNERQISYNPAAGISLKGTIRTLSLPVNFNKERCNMALFVVKIKFF